MALFNTEELKQNGIVPIFGRIIEDKEGKFLKDEALDHKQSVHVGLRRHESYATWPQYIGIHYISTLVDRSVANHYPGRW